MKEKKDDDKEGRSILLLSCFALLISDLKFKIWWEGTKYTWNCTVFRKEEEERRFSLRLWKEKRGQKEIIKCVIKVSLVMKRVIRFLIVKKKYMHWLVDWNITVINENRVENNTWLYVRVCVSQRIMNFIFIRMGMSRSASVYERIHFGYPCSSIFTHTNPKWVTRLPDGLFRPIRFSVF